MMNLQARATMQYIQIAMLVSAFEKTNAGWNGLSSSYILLLIILIRSPKHRNSFILHALPSVYGCVHFHCLKWRFYSVYMWQQKPFDFICLRKVSIWPKRGITDDQIIITYQITQRDAIWEMTNYDKWPWIELTS